VRIPIFGLCPIAESIPVANTVALPV
jgi:hypothetical protein